jgi:MFS family permease
LGSTSGAAVDSIFGPARRQTTLGMLILITLIAFESMAVAAALPTAARALHGLSSYGWAFTGFLVANVVGMVASGQLSDARGPRFPVAAGLACFLGGLVLSGTATTMAQFVSGRVVQGLGGGLIVTAVYVVVGELYPERLRPAVFAATSSAWVVPTLVGPAVSGALAQHVSWRWAFLGLIPFGVVGGVLLLPVLRNLRPHGSAAAAAGARRLLCALAVAAGVAALEQGGQHPSAAGFALGAAGLVTLIAGLRPLVPTGTFRVRPGVAAPVALRGLLAGTFFGVESLIPLSLTVQHGYGATVAGLPLAASGVSWALGSWWQGRVDDAAEPHRRVVLIRTGFVLVAVAAGGMALTALPSAPGWLAFPAWFCAGTGAGLAMSSVSVLLLNYTTDADRGADSAALQLADATASALTTGVGGVLVAAAARGAISDTSAFVGLDLAMAAIAAGGVLVAGRARAGGRAAAAP